MPDSRSSQYRFWGKVDPQQRAHLALVAPAAAAQPASGGKTAVFHIYDPIDSWGAPWGVSARDVMAALAALDDDVETLELRINSPGGEAFEAMAIINALRAHPARVVAVVDSLAASAAADIAISADHTVMADNAQLMIHRAWGLEIGTTADLTMYAQMLANLDNAQADLMTAKAGGTREEWLDAMTPGTWYSAADAKTAGLVDEVRAVAPADAEKANAQARFDLSMLPTRDPDRQPFAPAARAAASQTPAEPPVAPSTNSKEADTMSDTLIQGLREQLGLSDDADEATVLAANAEALNEKADPPAAASVDLKSVVAALEADGKVVVSKARFDALEAQATEGAKARATQIEGERDSLISAAMDAGKISRSDESRAVWAKEFARDFETAKADLESLPARFPVGPTTGHAGDDGSTGGSAAFTDDQADALAERAGISKEGLLR